MNKVIGLTGGIASGKSTVVDFLRSRDYSVIDADQIVHKLQEPTGKLYQAILTNFGADFFDKDGKLKRKKLSTAVFSDVLLREKLAVIQDKIIREELEKQRQQLLYEPLVHGLFFMDIPLLFEQNYTGFDEIWLVSIDKEKQLLRLMERNQLTKEAALQRMTAQMPLSEKRKRADRIFDNSGSLDELYEQVTEALKEITEEGGNEDARA